MIATLGTRWTVTLTSILTSHSRESTVLMLRNSGSDFLCVLGLTTEKLFLHLTRRAKSLSSWLVIPILDPRKCDSLTGNVKQGTRRDFHRNWCPEELGFTLYMKLPNFPISFSVIWHLQQGLPHQEQTCARQRSPRIQVRMRSPHRAPCQIFTFILQGLPAS